jgi:hypothetical protein
VYRAYPGEQPTLVGGCVLNGWEHVEASIYRVPIGDWPCWTLFENGERATMARWPKQGYLHVAQRATDDSLRQFGYGADDLPDFEPHDAQVFIWPGEGEWNWMSQTQPITAIDREARLISMADPAAWPIDAGARYFVQGARAFLSAPGEFALDSAEGYLYYWPRQTPIAAQTIIAPTTTRLISLQGRSAQQPLEHVHMEGLRLHFSDFTNRYRMPISEAEDNDEWEEARSGLVYLENARHCVVRACTISGAGFSGVLINRYAQHNTIADNSISDSGCHGVYLAGWGIGQGPFDSAEASYVNKHNRILNNRISDGGRLVGHGSGIQLYYSGDNKIAHNTITRFPRYGISLLGLRHKVMQTAYYGIPVTWENHWNFLHARNNTIQFNDISAVMQDSQDGGMIQAWGPGRGNLIDGNHLHHSGIHFSFGFAIYLDDAADDFTVSNNLIHDLYQSGSGRLRMVIFTKGIGNRLINNVLINNAAEAAFGSMEMADEENRDLEIVRNICVNSGLYAYDFINWSEQRIARADHNIFYRADGPPEIRGCPAATTWAEWRAAFVQRYDQHSLTVEPGFVDVDRHDYRFIDASAARALGIQPLAVETMGYREA